MRKVTLPFAAAFVSAANALGQPGLPALPTPAPPTPLKGFSYDAPFLPNINADPNVPTPDSVLGFRLGDKAATHAQIEAVIKAIAAKSPRVKLFEYARSHEGRTLYYLVVGSEANMARLDAIKADAAALADPRSVAAAESDRLITTMPAIAWMAYCIHGDEMSGSDAALALLYRLAAGRDAETTALLDTVLVLIDPLMNPDGRDRCIAGIAQNRTAQPNVDDQAVIHAQTWPSGRMNHYLFDMNRDWIFATQPESRGRIAAAGAWNPHYFMESHEMGSQDTFLFMPARAPINHNYAPTIREWHMKFAADHGAAFDANAWRYYTGEWNEGWYPGYSGSWGALRGAIDNLYEQANINVDAVRRGEGTLEHYREGVHKQLVSSWANLATLAKNREAILRDFAADRRAVVDASGPNASRVFAIAPGANTARVRGFVELMTLQGVEVYRAPSEFNATGRDWLGRPVSGAPLPAGTLLIPARQPQGRFASAVLELDPRMADDFLVEERRELLRFGRSRLYDITGWNLAMFNGLETWELTTGLPTGAARVQASDFEPPKVKLSLDGVVGVSLGNDDAAIAAAARLLDAGVRLRMLDKATTLGGTNLPRGCVLALTRDNTSVADWKSRVSETAAAFEVALAPVSGGLGAGDLPDIGGEHFVLLEAPRVAVFQNEPFNPYSTGEIWHLLDHEAGLRIAMLNTPNLGGMDLRRYNVLIAPDGGASALGEHLPAIRAWVEAGGTMIAVGSSATAFAKEGGIGSTRLLPDVVAKLDDYRAAIVRDWLGKSASVDAASVWSNTAPTAIEYPWTLGEPAAPPEEEAKRRDQWRSLFMPQGALLAARVDDRHWLTGGCGPVLPVLVSSSPVLLPRHGGNAPLLLGEIVKSSAPPAAPTTSPTPPAPTGGEGAAKTESAKPPPPGWTVAPPGHELRLRMSGLLWPEAADRLAHGAYVTQERVGAGQIILFADSPTFRAATKGTSRVLLNAVVLGPGAGASHPIRP